MMSRVGEIMPDPSVGGSQHVPTIFKRVIGHLLYPLEHLKVGFISREHVQIHFISWCGGDKGNNATIGATVNSIARSTIRRRSVHAFGGMRTRVLLAGATSDAKVFSEEARELMSPGSARSISPSSSTIRSGG